MIIFRFFDCGSIEIGGAELTAGSADIGTYLPAQSCGETALFQKPQNAVGLFFGY